MWSVDLSDEKLMFMKIFFKFWLTVHSIGQWQCSDTSDWLAAYCANAYQMQKSDISKLASYLCIYNRAYLACIHLSKPFIYSYFCIFTLAHCNHTPQQFSTISHLWVIVSFTDYCLWSVTLNGTMYTHVHMCNNIVWYVMGNSYNVLWIDCVWICLKVWTNYGLWTPSQELYLCKNHSKYQWHGQVTDNTRVQHKHTAFISENYTMQSAEAIYMGLGFFDLLSVLRLGYF